MTNALIKEAITTYIPGSPGVPADPGQQALPARTVWETRTVCGWEWPNGSTWIQTETGEWVSVPNIPPGGTSVAQTYVCRETSVPVQYPAQAYRAPTPAIDPVPSQFITDYQLGWNAGARSIKLLLADGYASFVVPHTVTGAFVGLNDADLSAGYTELDYAIYAHRGYAEVYERGVSKHYIGAYAAGTVFKIRRRQGVVTYLVNDVVVYTSLTPSSGSLFLDVSMYTAGDYVDSPAIVEEFTGSAALSFETLKLLGVGRDSAAPVYATASAELSFLPMTVEARAGIHVAMSMQPMSMLASDHPYGSAALSMEPMTLTAEAGLIKPTYGLATLSMVPMGIYATGLTGEIGSAAMSFPPMDMLAANKPYGEAYLTMPAPTMRAYTYADAKEAQAMSGGRVVTPTTVQSFLGVVATSVGTGESLYLVDVQVDVTALSSAEAVSTHEIQQILSAAAYTIVAGNTVLPLEDQSPEVWVVNTENLGTTRYENYGFNSFAKIDGRYYGAKSDGIYLLEGDSDDTVPIQAMVSFGQQNFGTASLKTASNAYLGVSSSGKLFLKVIVEGNEYLYAARDASDKLQTQRVDFGRGIRANYLEFEMYNADGDDFELASVEFLVAQFNRRI